MSSSKERLKGIVHIRGGFSDQNGIIKFNKEMQLTEFDDITRSKISNLLYRLCESLFSNMSSFLGPMDRCDELAAVFCRDVLDDVFCETYKVVFNYNENWRHLFERIHEAVMKAEYNEVLDLIQYICCWLSSHMRFQIMTPFIVMNKGFEQEYVGYRFIDKKIVAITDKQEINAITQACNCLFDGCRKQIQNAVGFLSDRENKDYKNCIKESISAVESLCQVITGDKKATLSDALKKIERNGTIIHRSLNQAFQKLYAYTCDQGGIRHAEGMFESNVTFEEAKFMLVSCSAFINYLIAEYGKGSK